MNLETVKAYKSRDRRTLEDFACVKAAERIDIKFLTFIIRIISRKNDMIVDCTCYILVFEKKKQKNTGLFRTVGIYRLR